MLGSDRAKLKDWVKLEWTRGKTMGRYDLLGINTTYWTELLMCFFLCLGSYPPVSSSLFVFIEKCGNIFVSKERQGDTVSIGERHAAITNLNSDTGIKG